MDVKFGTSGLRGLASDLVAGSGFCHVAAFGRLLLDGGHTVQGGQVFVGRDLRDSSPVLARQVLTALSQCGLEAVDCGQTPTPALAYYAFKRGCAAVMVTGSHIPADRNGIKFYLPGAEISKQDEARIIEKLGTAQVAKAEPLRGNGSLEAVLAQWLARYRPLLPDGCLSGMRIGIHQHSSVAAETLGQLLGGFGAVVVPFGHSSRFMPVDTEAVGDNLVDLYRSKARTHQFDAIVSTDADGDRPLVTDENGTPIAGDLLGMMAALWVGADAIATPVTSNSAIDSRAGIKVVRTRVGSPHVVEAMDAAISSGSKCVAGFEANGGFLLGSQAWVNGAVLPALPTRDSLLPILAVFHTMRETRLAASMLSQWAGFRAKAADRLSDYSQERSGELMRRLLNEPGFASRFLVGLPVVSDRNSVDGLRLAFKDGSVLHFRPSGNAPEMRCYCEAHTQPAAQELLAEGLNRLARFGVT